MVPSCGARPAGRPTSRDEPPGEKRLEKKRFAKFQSQLFPIPDPDEEGDTKKKDNPADSFVTGAELAEFVDMVCRVLYPCSYTFALSYSVFSATAEITVYTKEYSPFA